MDSSSDSFYVIQVSTLQEGRVPAMDLFIKREDDEVPILFLSRSLKYNKRVAKNVAESGITQLWIAPKDASLYEKYLSKNIASIIRDPNVPIESRCSLTYDLSIEIMKEVYETEDPHRVMKQSNEVLQNIIEVIFADPKAANSFIALASMDYNLYSHSLNVCLYGMALAKRALNISKEKALTRFGPGLLLHDIGLLSVPKEILNKPGDLTEEEWQIIKQHPQKGLEMVKEFMSVNEETRDMILYHHERLDGSGYPDGLKKSEISTAARICSIVDAFDAISTNRPFKERKSSFEAFIELKKEDIPHRLDATYFDEFIRVFQPVES